MAQRKNYWSCSKFADWVRGTVKGGAKTGSGWREWEDNAKQKYPVRYWIAEEALDAIQNSIWWPADKIYDAKYYINNRFVTETHALTAQPRDIPLGTWCDVGYRFLPCLFNELVDFVEIELAWSHIAGGIKEDRTKYGAPFWATSWFRWRTWRSAQAGLDHLEWASKLTFDEEWIAADDPNYKKPTLQALGAMEIRELYQWWTEVYRNRPDPHEASGWSAWCDRKRDKNGHKFCLDDETETAEEKAECKRILDLLHKIEGDYKAEEEAMMIRLIKIRESLWT
jgi:hypothetical protein